MIRIRLNVLPTADSCADVSVSTADISHFYQYPTGTLDSLDTKPHVQPPAPLYSSVVRLMLPISTLTKLIHASHGTFSPGDPILILPTAACGENQSDFLSRLLAMDFAVHNDLNLDLPTLSSHNAGILSLQSFAGPSLAMPAIADVLPEEEHLLARYRQIVSSEQSTASSSTREDLEHWEASTRQFNLDSARVAARLLQERREKRLNSRVHPRARARGHVRGRPRSRWSSSSDTDQSDHNTLDSGADTDDEAENSKKPTRPRSPSADPGEDAIYGAHRRDWTRPARVRDPTELRARVRWWLRSCIDGHHEHDEDEDEDEDDQDDDHENTNSDSQPSESSPDPSASIEDKYPDEPPLPPPPSWPALLSRCSLHAGLRPGVEYTVVPLPKYLLPRAEAVRIAAAYVDPTQCLETVTLPVDSVCSSIEKEETDISSTMIVPSASLPTPQVNTSLLRNALKRGISHLKAQTTSVSELDLSIRASEGLISLPCATRLPSSLLAPLPHSLPLADMASVASLLPHQQQHASSTSNSSSVLTVASPNAPNTPLRLSAPLFAEIALLLLPDPDFPASADAHAAALAAADRLAQVYADKLHWCRRNTSDKVSVLWIERALVPTLSPHDIVATLARYGLLAPASVLTPDTRITPVNQSLPSDGPAAIARAVAVQTARLTSLKASLVRALALSACTDWDAIPRPSSALAQALNIDTTSLWKAPAALSPPSVRPMHIPATFTPLYALAAAKPASTTSSSAPSSLPALSTLACARQGLPIVLLSGPPGAGKAFLLRDLSSRSARPLVYIGVRDIIMHARALVDAETHVHTRLGAHIASLASQSRDPTLSNNAEVSAQVQGPATVFDELSGLWKPNPTHTNSKKTSSPQDPAALGTFPRDATALLSLQRAVRDIHSSSPHAILVFDHADVFLDGGSLAQDGLRLLQWLRAQASSLQGLLCVFVCNGPETVLHPQARTLFTLVLHADIPDLQTRTHMLQHQLRCQASNLSLQPAAVFRVARRLHGARPAHIARIVELALQRGSSPSVATLLDANMRLQQELAGTETLPPLTQPLPLLRGHPLLSRPETARSTEIADDAESDVETESEDEGETVCEEYLGVSMPTLRSHLRVVGDQFLCGHRYVWNTLRNSLRYPPQSTQPSPSSPSLPSRTLGNGAGVLLYGPSGCGKSLLARLIATSLGHAVFSISAAWLFQSGVGESEKRLRDLFMEARRCAPALVLIDDIGALFPPDDDTDGASSIMAQLFILLDQLRLASPPVRIVATAAHPSHVNPALTRAGRLDHHVYIAPPSREERLSVLAYIHAVLNHDDKQAVVKQCQDVDLLLLARVSGGLTVSELLSLYSVLKKQDGVLDTRAWVLAILFVKKQAMME